jgi:rhodanese-related sulfurtransferase
MQQLMEFASNHYLLVGAFVVVFFLLIQDIAVNGFGSGSIDVKGATTLINQQDAIVIDVRTEGDFKQGHIINAQNIPMTRLKEQLNRLEPYKDTPVIINCRSGAQSSVACRLLRKEGFSQVYNLQGGILSWQNSGFPVSRKSK